MKFLIDILKKSSKGDNFRPAEAPAQYNDGIAKLNSLGSNQYDKLTTQRINAINKNSQVTGQQSENGGIIPGK
jgi:hypothetical protein